MIVALAGGVGGAKLADGLYRALGRRAGLGGARLGSAPPEHENGELTPDNLWTVSSEPPAQPVLTVIVNTADDFDLYDLRISPDADTVLYTLAGIANPATGWGVAGDTFTALEMLRRYGEDTWFQLGDRDFATHILRTQWLRQGRRPTEVLRSLGEALGVRAALLPMCDEPVATVVHTPDGELGFQDYFVRRRHADAVESVRFAGIEEARMTPEVRAELASAAAVVFCPSNPIVSIGPILAVPGIRTALEELQVPIVAVSPIVGGRALKGPADRMLAGMGHEVSPAGVASLYRDLLSGIVIDRQDAALVAHIEEMGLRVCVADTIMEDAAGRERLASDVLRFAEELGMRSHESDDR